MKIMHTSNIYKTYSTNGPSSVVNCQWIEFFDLINSFIKIYNKFVQNKIAISYRMLRVIRIEFRTNNGVLNEIKEPRGLLRSVKEWRPIGHTSRHEQKPRHSILEGQMKGERSRGFPRTTLIKKVIKGCGLKTYKELNIMASNKEEYCKTNLKVDYLRRWLSQCDAHNTLLPKHYDRQTVVDTYTRIGLRKPRLGTFIYRAVNHTVIATKRSLETVL
jgi:hypothetical protein